MPSRSSGQWQTRNSRKHSLGKLRRAHPASGATWNVQVVRGKMTSKCLWHACRALALGMVLMLLGAGMATIGYYADDLSIGSEIRGNATVRVKNESRGFHLNNLSYVGPIIMGFGGFIVVAACVMTFEARDSAAKVVPARFKMSSGSRSNPRSNNSSANSTRRANGMMHQSNRWDHHLGVFRTSPAEPPAPLDRQALTAALIHFSKAMGNSPRQSPSSKRFSRSGSVPNLSHRSSVNSSHLSPCRKQLLPGHSPHHHGHGRHLFHARGSRNSNSLVNRASRESASSLLHPGMLQFHRQALSVDESGPFYRQSSDSPQGSQSSVILADSHEGRIRDRTRRSDTAKRHVLSRQKPIEKEEPHSPKVPDFGGRRRSSTASDASYASRRIYRRTSSASRTPSIDSRSVQVELHSPETNRASPRTPRRFNSAQSSTPSVERECRSQLSVCSEPVTVRQLSGQSSLEPCVLEESPELEDKEYCSEYFNENNSKNEIYSKSSSATPLRKNRPDSLTLDGPNDNSKSSKSMDVKKFLYRSNSTRTFNRPKPKLINEYDPIYYISTNGSITTSKRQDDLYDSLEVINERRNKILKSAELQRNHTLLQQNSVPNPVTMLSTTENNTNDDQKSITEPIDKDIDGVVLILKNLKDNKTERIENADNIVDNTITKNPDIPTGQESITIKNTDKTCKVDKIQVVAGDDTTKSRLMTPLEENSNEETLPTRNETTNNRNSSESAQISQDTQITIEVDAKKKSDFPEA